MLVNKAYLKIHYYLVSQNFFFLFLFFFSGFIIWKHLKVEEGVRE